MQGDYLEWNGERRAPEEDVGTVTQRQQEPGMQGGDSSLGGGMGNIRVGYGTELGDHELWSPGTWGTNS